MTILKKILMAVTLGIVLYGGGIFTLLTAKHFDLLKEY